MVEVVQTMQNHYVFLLSVAVILSLVSCDSHSSNSVRSVNQKLESLSFKAPNTLAAESTASPINVHVVAHTHDDVGWLKTVDEYYYGANQSIQSAGVQYILDTVITELTRDSTRKFIYVEIGFFWRWWREQTNDTQNVVKGLVKSGQLEFINGGWCMHDEAGTYYEDMIDQMTLGHRFLLQNFGIVPKVGWQIDPFGHSSTNAYLFNETGFEALFFARMDYQDYNYRVPQKALEMQWKMSASLPDRQILTGMMYGGYCSPNGYMFEYGDDPIRDDPLLEDYNVVQKANTLVNYVKGQANLLRHNDIMISWGCDFMYQNAHLMFKNIEKVMAYINARTATYNVTLFYSTPSMYAEAISKQSVQWPLKTDDFFPYADHPHAYWTGYFTSRPTLKGYVRSSNNLLQATTQLYSLSGLQSDSLKQEIFNIQEPMGVLQHHDAVAGTEQQHVADDYAKRLWVGSGYAFDVISQVVSSVIGGKAPVFSFCPLLNETICPATNDLSNKKSIAVVAYNPLGWTRTEYVTLPIPVPTVSVVDSNGKAVVSQVSTSTPYTVTFAITTSALAFTTYFVQPTSSNFHEGTEAVHAKEMAGPFILANSFLSVSLDVNGNFVSYTNKVSGKTVSIKQEYLYYISSTGTPSDSQCSGAYIFRPASNSPGPFSTAIPVVTFSNGSLYSEVRRVFSSYLSQVIRVYAGQTHVEVVDIIGPIDTSDGVGKEVITRYTTDLATQDTFYTDSNGIEFITRKINYRPSWPYVVEEPNSGNYYPINSAAYIKDLTKNAQFTMLTDRSRGGGSVISGQLEAMIQRATLKDDARGVDQPINEHNVVCTTEWLIVDAATTSASNYRQSIKRIAHPLVLSFATIDSVSAWKSQYKTDFMPFQNPLPANVQLLTFAPTQNVAEYILRFHHIYQVGEDPTLSQPVTIDINSFFSKYLIATAVETQLTSVSKSTRGDAINFTAIGNTRQPINVLLKPVEIRTFIITLKAATAPAKSPISIII